MTTLREFLVSIDWDADKGKVEQNKFEAAITSATVKATLFADAIELIASKLVEAISVTTTKFNDLYNAAQRTNTAAAFINDFSETVKRLGGSAEAARSSIEQMSLKLKENPAIISKFNMMGFGTNAETGKLEVQQKMLNILHGLTDAVIIFTAGEIGEDPQVALLMKRNYDTFLIEQERRETIRKRLGFNFEQAEKDAHAFMLALLDVEQRISNIWDKFTTGLGAALTEPMKEFGKFLDKNAPAIRKLIEDVTTAIGNLVLAWSRDFAVILHDPDTLKGFQEGFAALGNTIKYLAEQMAGLVGWLQKLTENAGKAADIANYLSGNKSDPESYARGRAMMEPIDAAINPSADTILKGIQEQNEAPPWDWKGAAGRAFEWGKGVLGIGDAKASQAPAGAGTLPPTAPTGARGPAATGGAFAIGDSIAEGTGDALGAPGVTRVGAGSKEILDKIKGLTPFMLANKTVILSGGASNSHDPAALTAQIDALKELGVDPSNIRVMGVGTRQDFFGYNVELKKIAEKMGASFVPITTDPGGVHPTSYAKAAADAMAARSAAPVAKGSPYGQLPPFTSPPVPAGAWASPFALGGSATQINAPSQTTIHIDGTGDPTGVAHLVHEHQNAVNADLTGRLGAVTP